MTTAEPEPIRVDQAFHGYDRGHRELAASLKLDEESRAVMLEYSDLLADLDGSRGEAPYITCYPLPTASRHVLASTWPAGPGSRPGSVWTHSLLVDYQALARLTDLLVLRRLLVRSGSLQRTDALKPLQINPDEEADVAFGPEPRVLEAIRGLYGRCDDQVVVAAGERGLDELLALALWRQMWPGLRREFSFVSGRDTRSPGVGVGWMLSFGYPGVPSERGSGTAGLQALVNDLPEPGTTPLRRFLARYAIEAPSPRGAVSALAELWASPERDLDRRIAAVGKLVGRFELRRLARDLLFAELDGPDGSNALLAIVEQFGDQPLEVDPARVVATAAAMDDQAFRRLLKVASEAPQNRLGGRTFRALVADCPLERVAAAGTYVDRARLLAIRGELLEAPTFWPTDDDARAALIAEAPQALAPDWGWRLFGLRIGPLASAALLCAGSLPPPGLLIELLAGGDEATATLLADWALTDAAHCEAVLSSSDLDAIRSLAKAQIRAGPPATAAPEWIGAVGRVGADGPTSVLVVCLMSSLEVGGKEGFDAARRLFDPVLRLARRNRLSRAQVTYVEAAATTAEPYWNAADYLIRLALLRWPPTAMEAGALNLSEDQEGARTLVDQAIAASGRASVEEALLDSSLPVEARRAIERRLQPPLLKFWWT